MLNSSLLNEALNYSKLWIAYSGGMDSRVLLELCAEFRSKYPHILLQAVHINHGLSAHANEWAEQCSQNCAALKIPLRVVKIQLTRRSELGLEAAAREERYRVFAELLQANEALLTAHNANDQAETVLLQLLRGAGPKGLAAMPVKKKLGAGVLWRPLLSAARAAIEEYADLKQLQWVEDESNVVEDYVRNYLRHQILPKLRQHWPASLDTIARSAAHCAEAAHLLEELAAEDLRSIQLAEPQQIDLKSLRKLSDKRQRNVLRYWFKTLNFPLPETRRLLQLQQQIMQAKEDAQPLVSWAELECRRFADRLYVMKARTLSSSRKNFAWPQEQSELRAVLGEEKFSLLEKTIAGLSQRLKPEDQLSVRFRQGGEQCKLVGRAGTHKLKKLLQEKKIPPWEREYLPLVYINEELWLGEGFK